MMNEENVNMTKKPLVDVGQKTRRAKKMKTAQTENTVDKISKILEKHDNVQENQGKIQDTMLSHLNDHGKAITIMLDKQAHYDKVIPHLERKSTLTDRRVNGVEQKVDYVEQKVNSFGQKVDSFGQKLDQLLKAQGKSSKSEGKPARRTAKCKFCSKEMLQTSLFNHLKRKNCPVLRSTDEVAEMKVKARLGGKRIP